MGNRFSIFFANVKRVDQNDIIIAVVGQTGAGKSTFINSAVGRDVLRIGRSLKPETREIQHVEYSLTIYDQQQRIILVEAPGFDSEKGGNIPKKLGIWLKTVSSKKLKISGILYFHRITDRFIPLTDDLVLMKTLCEESSRGFPNRIVMVTTRWGKLREDTVGESREEQLQKYWDQMPWAQGSAVSRVMRFDGSSESAESIIYALLEGR